MSDGRLLFSSLMFALEEAEGQIEKGMEERQCVGLYCAFHIV
jgi:hypothetical protein